MDTCVKQGSARAIAAEAAGLAELGEAAEAGGAPTVKVWKVTEHELHTCHLLQRAPTAAAAEEFGRRLAFTHAYCPSGQRIFGQAPAGFADSASMMGALPLPVVSPSAPARPWGLFYAEDRILPYLAASVANGSIGAKGAAVIERLCERLRDGILDSPQPRLVRVGAALIHGDLWSGNLLWVTAQSAAHAARLSPDTEADDAVVVLIDPAAHGGHAESDLAQLSVFGAPFTDRIWAAYDEVSPLAAGWEERIRLHQLHMLMIHAALFGGGYGTEAVSAAQKYV